MTVAATPRRHRTLRSYAAAIIALATLGACTGADAAAPPPTTPSASTTTSATPTTSKPSPSPTSSVDQVIAKIPKSAREKTKKGAQSFARYFIESLNAGATKPDSTVLMGLFQSSCETCQAMFASLQELEAKKQRHLGPSIRVLSTTALASSTLSAQVLIDVEQRAVKVVDERGTTLRNTAAGPGTFVMTMSFRDGHWTATRLQTVS